MILMSAVIGFIISSSLKEKDLRVELTRKLAVVGMIGGIVIMMSFLWYIQTLPQSAWDLFHDVLWARDGMLRIIVAGIITVYLLIAFALPRSINTFFAVVMMLVIGVIGVWQVRKCVRVCVNRMLQVVTSIVTNLFREMSLVNMSNLIWRL